MDESNFTELQNPLAVTESATTLPLRDVPFQLFIVVFFNLGVILPLWYLHMCECTAHQGMLLVNDAFRWGGS